MTSQDAQRSVLPRPVVTIPSDRVLVVEAALVVISGPCRRPNLAPWVAPPDVDRADEPAPVAFGHLSKLHR